MQDIIKYNWSIINENEKVFKNRHLFNSYTDCFINMCSSVTKIIGIKEILVKELKIFEDKSLFSNKISFSTKYVLYKIYPLPIIIKDISDKYKHKFETIEDAINYYL